jgi:hypothetical protein
MQAQDYAMAKWAVGIRLPDSTDKEIEAAIDHGEILRTHLLRPTWHFVSADDIYWMLELTAPKIIASMKFREKWLGLTGAVIARSNRVIEKALLGGEQLTREDLVARLNEANLRTDEYRSGHLLMRAELDGLICSGKPKGKKLYESTDSSSRKQTYALLEQRVPKKKRMSREESLEELARRYFSTRAPATLQDFAWWSGLSMADSRDALEMVSSKFVPEVIDGITYWSPDSLPVPRGRTGTFLLPAFDEFLIAYKDRNAALGRVMEKKLISQNGLFRPVIIIDGQATGLWKREIEKGRLIVEAKLFREHTKKEKGEIHRAAERFGKFLGVNTVDCKI